MNIEEIINLLQNSSDFSGIINEHEPLAQKSTFKVGGTARFFLSPSDISSFNYAYNLLKQNNIKHFILGGGSNIVFPDSEYQGVILSTSNLNSITILDKEQTHILKAELSSSIPELSQKINENTVFVKCLCGTPTATFVSFCTKNNLSGAEQFAGLPGSIGGALYMNARCFDKSISDITVATTHLTYSESQISEKELLFSPSQWDYKKSPFQKTKQEADKIVLNGIFFLTQKTSEQHSQIESDCKKFISERVDKGHFKFPSAGSVFKNNREFGKPSGKIIDECGLKGTQIGGAQIAPFHGNFIININHATASDIKKLVELCQKEVENKFNFKLQNEIIFVDN